MTTANAAHDLLKRAKALIEDPMRWTQNVYARNAYGREVSELSPDACRFCSMGALHRAAGILADDEPVATPTQLKHALRALNEQVGQQSSRLTHSMVQFNDTSTHRAVMAVFDGAIQATAPEVSA